MVLVVVKEGRRYMWSSGGGGGGGGTAWMNSSFVFVGWIGLVKLLAQLMGNKVLAH